jgi:hypothetical protein
VKPFDIVQHDRRMRFYAEGGCSSECHLAGFGWIIAERDPEALTVAEALAVIVRLERYVDARMDEIVNGPALAAAEVKP